MPIKRKLFSFTLIGLLFMCLPLFLTNATIALVNASNEYTLTLDGNNGNIANQINGYGSSTVNATTDANNSLQFGYIDGITITDKSKTNYLGQLKASSGEFYNVSTIKGIKSFTINYESSSSMYLYLSTSSHDKTNDKITVTSGNTINVEGYYSYFTLVTGNKFAYVKSINISYTCLDNEIDEPSIEEPDLPSSEITLSSLAIEGNLNKTNYIENESWDLSGLTLKATYSDASSVNLGALDSVVGLTYNLEPSAPTLNNDSLRIYNINYEGTLYSYAERTFTGITVTSSGSSEEPDVDNNVIRFELGANGSATHSDGNSASSYSETIEGYTLSLTGGTQMYTGTIDAKGNSAIKLGSNKNVGGFSLTVPTDVNSVNFYLAGYKNNAGSFDINDETYAISTLSDNGEYTCVTIDTSITKDIELSTSNSAKRGMVNAIEYVLGSESEEEPDTPITPTLTGVTIQGDMTQKIYNEGDEWNLAGLELFGVYFDKSSAKIADISEMLTRDDFLYELSPSTALKDTTSLIITVLYSDEAFEASKEITGITVNSSSSEEPSEEGVYKLVNSSSDLKIGSKVVIAQNTKGFTAGSISGGYLTNETSTFSTDKSTITSLGTNTTEFTLGGSSRNYTLTNEEGELLGATNVKKVAFNSGTTTWDVSISNGDATIQSTTNSYGRFLYNVGSPRFTTYTSETSDNMLIVQLYIMSGTSGGEAEEPDSGETDITTNTGDFYAPNSYSYRSGMENYNELDEVSPYDCDNAPATGNINVLVVPIAFSDSTDVAQTVLDDLEIVFNGDENSTGWESVSSYFNECSYGALNLEFTIAPKWYQYNQKASYMGVADTDETVAAVDSAVNWYKNTYSSNCQEFDSDSNGYIDCVFLVYAEEDYRVANSNYNNFWAYTFWCQNNNRSVSSPNANTFIWMSYDFMYGNQGGSSYIDIDAHTFIHEYGHAMGLDDYYDYGDDECAAGGFDMQDMNVSDHNPFSKMSLGWSKPYIVNGDATITISPASTNKDQYILIPSGGYNSWNKSPFDEYILLEYYTPEGLNKFDSDNRTYGYSYPQGPSTRGIRVYHIDARLYSMYVSGSYLYYYEYADTISSSYYYEVAANNTSSGDYASQIAPNYRLCHLLSKSGTDLKTSGSYFSSVDLFLKGNTFSMSTYSSYFYNSGKMNDGSSLGFSFEVLDITTESATIQFKKA